MPSEKKYTESQFANLWGRSQGILKEEVKLEIVPDTEPKQVKLLFKSSRKTDPIPPNAEVRLYLRHHLRLIDAKIGEKSIVFKNGGYESETFSLARFGKRWNKTRWQIKVTTNEDPGRVWAWTESQSILKGDSIITHDGEGILFIRKGKLPKEIAWKLDFPPEGPTIIIDVDVSKLEELLKKKSLVSALLVPEWISSILDEMIKLHLDGELLNAAENTWQSKWLNWFGIKYPKNQHKFVEDMDLDDVIEIMNWSLEIKTSLKKTIEQQSIIELVLKDEVNY